MALGGVGGNRIERRSDNSNTTRETKKKRMGKAKKVGAFSTAMGGKRVIAAADENG